MADQLDRYPPRGQPFRVLTLCTMNICRSPALEVCLADAVSGYPELPSGLVVIASAGTHARLGAPRCEISLAHVGRVASDQTARQLTGSMLANADLVLTAERKHADAVVAVSPEAGARCFTVREAARIASWVAADSSPVGSLSPGASSDSVTDRLRRFVAQMDCARGHLRPPSETRLPYGVEDVPDPHVLGINLHEMSAQMVITSVNELVAAAASTNVCRADPTGGATQA